MYCFICFLGQLFWNNCVCLFLLLILLSQFYNFLYTHHLPTHVHQWVEGHASCNDITFNFMVANFTGLPPVKVST